MLQILGLLITYFLLIVQFTSPQARSTSTFTTNSTMDTNYRSGSWDTTVVFIHSLTYSKERSGVHHFTPVSSVGCFAPRRIQSEVQWHEVVFHSTQPGIAESCRQCVTNGDGGLMQATLEAVDGSRLGRFSVKVVPLGDCSGVKTISVCWCQDAFELVMVMVMVNVDLYSASSQKSLMRCAR